MADKIVREHSLQFLASSSLEKLLTMVAHVIQLTDRQTEFIYTNPFWKLHAIF